MNLKRIAVIPLLLIVAICLMGTTSGGCEDTERSRQMEEKLQDADALMKLQPTPHLKFSMDRHLLKERLIRFNDPNKMCYLYICTIDGTWLKLTIVGKVASTSKRLTNPEGYDYNGSSYYSTQLPDEMGTWGASEPAKVGMTTIGSLLEYGGFMTYFLSEVPLTFEGLGKPMVSLKIEMPAEERAQFLQSLETLQSLRRQA